MLEFIRKAKLMHEYHLQLEADLLEAEQLRKAGQIQAERDKVVIPNVLIEATTILWRDEQKRGEL